MDRNKIYLVSKSLPKNWIYDGQFIVKDANDKYQYKNVDIKELDKYNNIDYVLFKDQQISLPKLINIIKRWINKGEDVTFNKLLVEKLYNFTTHILVYCHNKKIKTDMNHTKIDNGHWQFEIFNSIINMYNLNNIIIKTVDILPGGDYMADGFSDDFINKYSGKFNIVILPDCGGDFFTFQENKQIEKLNALFEKILRLLKINGILIVGKILNEDYYKQILGHFENSEIKVFEHLKLPFKYIFIPKIK